MEESTMRFKLSLLAFAAAALGVAEADAASCSAFAVIKSFDPAKSTVEVDYGTCSMSKFFPKPEGAPSDTTKQPGTSSPTRMATYMIERVPRPFRIFS